MVYVPVIAPPYHHTVYNYGEPSLVVTCFEVIIIVIAVALIITMLYQLYRY
jgi:hypothetical protein